MSWHHLLVWLGVWIGYRSAHRTRAILVTIGVAAVLLFAAVYFPLPDVFNLRTVIWELGWYPVKGQPEVWVPLLHVALVASAYGLLRCVSLRRVDHLLGRGTRPAAHRGVFL